MRASFTLIELLVVIAIIGGLAALLFPNFMNARQLARDAQRKSDLKQIQKALELYRQDQTDSSFPATLPSVGSSFTGTNGVVYMSKFPGDPNRSPSFYYYNRDTTTTYTLCACVENIADPDTNISTADCAASYTCSTTPKKSYTLHEP